MMSWLSGFLLNPLLAAGAIGVASPILIHFLSRRRFRRVRWAAMDFLLDAQRRNRRRVRLEQLILLALRCLAVMLLAMLVARPFLRHGALASLVGIGPRSERIILIDDSYSMGARSVGGQTAFSRAADAARQLVELFSREAPGDAVTVLTTSDPARPLTALPRIDAAGARRVADALEAAAPTHGTARFESAFDELGRLLAAAPSQANAVLYVISDFQRPDWSAANEPPDADERSPVSASLEQLAERSANLSLVMIDVSAPRPDNLAVIDLAALQSRVVAGVPARFEARVANYSLADAAHVELSLSIGEQVIPPVQLGPLSPGEVRREPLEVTFPMPGSVILNAKVSGAAAEEDCLALDDARGLAIDVRTAVQVLIVDGEPSGDPFRDEVYLLRTALRPPGRAASGNDLTVITEADLDGVDLSAFEVVVLANVARLSAAGLRSLETFVREGGGVLVTAGRQLDTAWYNEQLHRGGRGMLPLALGDVVEAPASGAAFHIAEWDAGHPVLRAFVDPLAALLRQVRFDAFVTAAELASAANNNITASRPAEQAASAPPRVLARLGDGDQSPLLVEGRFGRGVCLLLTTTVDQDWNDWASSFTYLPIMLELVQYAARPDEAALTATVGQPLICPVDPRGQGETASVRGPTYPLVAESIIAARPVTPGGAPAFTLIETERVGGYEFRLSAAAGLQTVRRGSVNADPRESDLTPATPAQLAAALGEVPFVHVRDVDALFEDGGAMRTELWWPVLMLVVIVLMTEHGLAWWFGTRG